MNTNSMKYVSDKLKGEQRQKEEKSKNEREQVKKNPQYILQEDAQNTMNNFFYLFYSLFAQDHLKLDK